jgi:hypothetical protein
MGDVQFPSTWSVWTRAQREKMFEDHVLGVCRERGYSNDKEWRVDRRGIADKHNLSGHYRAVLSQMKSQGRLDSYADAVSAAKIAADAICPQREGGGSGTGSGGHRSLLSIMLSPDALLKFFGIRLPEARSFGGVSVAGEGDPAATPDISAPLYDAGEASDASAAICCMPGFFAQSSAAALFFAPVPALP